MKKNVKVIIGITLWIIIGASTIVGATTIFRSEDITYSSPTNKTNVKDSLDELYGLVNTNSNNLPVTGKCDQVAKPNLGSNNKLIPVIIRDNGKVIKVSETDSNWYDYCQKKWANAVILNDGTTKDDITNGKEISTSKINSYFVWIPKYKYKLWNVESLAETTEYVMEAHSIDIVFDTTNTTDAEGESCKTSLISGESGNCDNGEYMTHPAFITMGTNGFWVGKFETGKLDTAIQVDGNSTNIRVVPGVESWRNITVKEMFDNSLNYSTTLNSHMMKNTEWGAVAYLSHSVYGINTEVRINNNSSFLTGYSSYQSYGTYPGNGGNGGNYNAPYNTETGYLASTTGNISGIYDMRGGGHEYMASYRQDSYGSSGFDATSINSYNSKYFDIYNATSEEQTYQYRILGDATGEMGPMLTYKDGDGLSRRRTRWYGDYSDFVEATTPWFVRGGRSEDGPLAGQFFFARSSGEAHRLFGTRLVLSP